MGVLCLCQLLRRIVFGLILNLFKIGVYDLRFLLPGIVSEKN